MTEEDYCSWQPCFIIHHSSTRITLLKMNPIILDHWADDQDFTKPKQSLLSFTLWRDL